MTNMEISETLLQKLSGIKNFMHANQRHDSSSTPYVVIDFLLLFAQIQHL